MLLLNSPAQQSLNVALSDLEKSGSPDEWAFIHRLDRNFLTDGFLTLLAHYENTKTYDVGQYSFPYPSLNDWIMHADEWDKSMRKATADIDPYSMLLFDLRQHFEKQLKIFFRRARTSTGIGTPNSGSGWFLVFVGGLSRCLVMRFTWFESSPQVKVEWIIDEPRAAFDVWPTIKKFDNKARNYLKEFLQSGHKIIIHRGVFIHVDRRHDINVFGPSIDTLLLAEILAQEVFEREVQLDSALEVGCGSGLLTCSLATHAKGLTELFAIDSHFGSVSCTHRNLSTLADVTRNLKSYLLWGDFRSDLFTRKFDLVVCNPPYLPLPRHIQSANPHVPDYFAAVGGTRLLKEVIQSAPNILTPRGRMLLLTSSLSLPETLSYIPSTCEYSQPLGENGYRVSFEVEAVLNNPEWKSFLLQERNLEDDGGLYFHTLHPIWITLRH